MIANIFPVEIAPFSDAYYMNRTNVCMYARYNALGCLNLVTPDEPRRLLPYSVIFTDTLGWRQYLLNVIV